MPECRFLLGRIKIEDQAGKEQVKQVEDDHSDQGDPGELGLQVKEVDEVLRTLQSEKIKEDHKDACVADMGAVGLYPCCQRFDQDHDPACHKRDNDQERHDQSGIAAHVVGILGVECREIAFGIDTEKVQHQKRERYQKEIDKEDDKSQRGVAARFFDPVHHHTAAAQYREKKDPRGDTVIMGGQADGHGKCGQQNKIEKKAFGDHGAIDPHQFHIGEPDLEQRGHDHRQPGKEADV